MVISPSEILLIGFYDKLMVIRLILYIEDSVLRFVCHGFRFILEQMAADHCETETEDPSSLTELHLSISDLFLEEQSVKYTDI